MNRSLPFSNGFPRVCPGPSGLRVEHLQALEQHVRPALVRFLRTISTEPENLPEILLQSLRRSRLVPLAKNPNSESVPSSPRLRPIGIPEVLRKVASQWVLQHVVPRARDFLLPTQLGVGVSGGSEAVLHTIQAHLHYEPAHILLKLDLENAFNRVDRRLAKRILEARFPELLPLYVLGYGPDSANGSYHFGWLPEEGSPSSTRDRFFLRSRTGVQQGDPLAPVLHALALSPYLMAMRSLFPNITVLALHDDISLVGPYYDIQEAFHWSQRVLSSLRARLQPDKCVLFGHRIDSPRLVNHDFPAVEVTRQGVMLHSVPMGTRAFVIRACRQLQNTHAKLVKGIQKLPEGELQTKLALFRYCVGPRLDYHLRCLALPFGALLATEADTITMHELDTLCGSLLTLQGLPPEELNTVKAQIRLPRKWGGLGLATRVRIHPIAFYAAWLRTLQNNFTCNAFLSRLGTACRGADPSAEHLLDDLASSTDQLQQQLSLASRWTTSRLSSRTSARIRKIALWSTALPTGDAAPASTNPPLAGPLQQILSQESHRRAFEDIVDDSALDDRTIRFWRWRWWLASRSSWHGV